MFSSVGAALARFLDVYTLRARLLPAILGAAPALAALLLLISWKSFELSTIVSVLAMLALVFALSDWARRAGKKLEPQIYTEMGGKPSVTMMYRGGDAIDEPSKDRYRAFLAGKVNQPEPTLQVEAATPATANGFYELTSTWLRENTRDTKRFSILFNENVTYGFRRNLLGIKAAALGLNALVVLICAGLLWYRSPFNPSDDMTARIIVVFVVAAAHAFYFLLVVNRDAVKTAARTYARQLIISCETLIGGGGAPRPRARLKEKAPAS